MGSILDSTMGHLKFVWMDESLILLELMIKSLDVYIVARLQAKELEIANVS